MQSLEGFQDSDAGKRRSLAWGISSLDFARPAKTNVRMWD